jgi:hypothetical protein
MGPRPLLISTAVALVVAAVPVVALAAARAVPWVSAVITGSTPASTTS